MLLRLMNSKVQTPNISLLLFFYYDVRPTKIFLKVSPRIVKEYYC